ncbi:TPA: hypothetical protein ACH3X2_013648 [Trebouxia sp. C0005]
MKSLLEDSRLIGRFACAHAPNRRTYGPDLHVSGVGRVEFPWTQSEPHRLQQRCQQEDLPQWSPAGQNDQKVWQARVSTLTICNPDWDNTVRSLAQHSSKELGLLSTSSIEAVLQEVTLIDQSSSYNFSSQADTPPDAFATMIVLLLQPWAKVKARVHQGSQVLVVSNLAPYKITLTKKRQVCIACFKGCEYTLQVTGNRCYTSMVYHLVQPASLPVVIKDRAWYFSCLKTLLGPRRSFYLFEHLYKGEHLFNVKKLQMEYQQMASLLAEAEQQHLIDVFLVMVTQVVPRDRQIEQCPKANLLYGGRTTVSHWRLLDGTDPKWRHESINLEEGDCILQGADWLRQHVCAGFGVQRRYSRAGFVIWHRQNQWPLKYVQCSSVAHAKLRQLLASHTALTAPADPPTAKADSDGDGSMSPSQPIQEEQDLIACRQDIVSLIPAIFSRFEGKDLASFDTPGFGTFGDIALAFGLPHIYVGFLKKKLKGLCLDLGTAGELIHASKVIRWSSLYPLLTKLAEATGAWTPTWSAWGVRYFLEALQGLELLLGVKDSGMVSAVAAIAVQVAHALQQVISVDSYRMLLSPDGDVKPGYSTKICDYSATEAMNMGDDWCTPWHIRAYYGGSDDGMRADTCKLVVTTLELFQSLTAKAKQAGISIEGLEEAIGTLVAAYLTHPQYFHVVEVLGPACMGIAGPQAQVSRLAESPAAIKLLAGCVQQLRRAAQPQLQSLDMPDRCTCNVCQTLQSFLAHPDEVQTLALGDHKDAEHGFRQLQPYADSQGHVCAVDISYQTVHWCIKESDADKLRRVQEATSMLATLHSVFSQVVLWLFLQRARPPPEDHATVQMPGPEQGPETLLTLLSLQQSVT